MAQVNYESGIFGTYGKPTAADINKIKDPARIQAALEFAQKYGITPIKGSSTRQSGISLWQIDNVLKDRFTDGIEITDKPTTRRNGLRRLALLDEWMLSGNKITEGFLPGLAPVKGNPNLFQWKRDFGQNGNQNVMTTYFAKEPDGSYVPLKQTFGRYDDPPDKKGLGGLGGLIGAGLGMAVGMPWLGSLAGGVLSDGELGFNDLIGAGLSGFGGDLFGGGADFFGEGTAGALADWGAGAAGAAGTAGGSMDWGNILSGAGDFFGEGTAGADVDWSNILNGTQYAPENVVDLFNNAGTEGFNNLGESWTSLADNLFNNAGMPGYDQYGQAASPWYQSLLQQATDDPLGTAAKTLRTLQNSGLLSSGAQILGGVLSGNAAQDAAGDLADAQLAAARIAADAAKFKPVGVKTRFGESNFVKDAQGNVVSAGYALTPDMKAQQDALIAQSGQMLDQYRNAPAAFAPMGAAGQRAMELGQGYLATTPQEQAAKYMAEQQALLATGRERDMNQMLTGEFNRGTYGLSTGGTSTGMQGANPRLEALYNAQRQQDLGLAAQATQGGMDYAKFGAGMMDIGGALTRGMYQGQTAAYDPYKVALGGAQTLEGLGQNAMDLGVNMGKLTSNAQSGALLAGGMNAAAQTQANAAYSPWGTALMAGGNALNQLTQPQQQQPQYAFNPYTGQPIL